MNRNFSRILLSVYGEPLMESEGKPLTLGKVVIEALLNEIPHAPATGENKLARWQLAKAIASHTVVDVSAEQIAMIKDQLGKTYSPVVVGPAFALLEESE